MKKIQREVKTYTDIYVSIDGKEFKNEADCEAWENSYRGTLEASFQALKKVKEDATKFGLPNGSYDDEVWVVKPNNLEEITLLNAYISCRTYDNCTRLTTEMIGKEIALNFGYDGDYCDIYVLEKHLKNLEKVISDVESKLNSEEEN